MTCGIYSIMNKISGRRYVGQSKDVEARLREHRSALSSGRHSNSYLQRSYDKHGEDAFDFGLVLVCSEENLTMYEQAVADAYREDGLYNIGLFLDAPWRGGQRGSPSKRHREKLSKAYIGQVPWNKGKIGVYSKEMLERMSKANTGRRVLSGSDSPNYGKRLSKKHREKISEGLRVYYVTRKGV